VPAEAEDGFDSGAIQPSGPSGSRYGIGSGSDEYLADESTMLTTSNFFRFVADW
jgi:hypothetical protein